MKLGLKTFLIILLQVLFSIPLFGSAFLLLQNIITGYGTLILVGAILFGIATFLSLIVLRNKLTPEDAKKLSLSVACVYLGLGLISFFLDGDRNHIMYAVISYVEISFFIKRKFMIKKEIAAKI